MTHALSVGLSRQAKVCSTNDLNQHVHSCCSLKRQSRSINVACQTFHIGSNRVIDKLVNSYQTLPLRDQQFMLSNDVSSLLGMNGSRRKCKICQSCKACSFSRNYVSYQQHQETLHNAHGPVSYTHLTLPTKA